MGPPNLVVFSNPEPPRRLRLINEGGSPAEAAIREAVDRLGKGDWSPIDTLVEMATCEDLTVQTRAKAALPLAAMIFPHMRQVEYQRGGGTQDGERRAKIFELERLVIEARRIAVSEADA
jgi:hypothetical protein